MIVDFLTGQTNLIGDALCQSDINNDLSVDILDIVFIVTIIFQN